MEEDARAFLLRVVRSLTAGLLWLLINMTLGIYIGLLIFDRKPTIGNIIFYIWLAGSLVFLVWYLYKVWSVEDVQS